MLLKSADPKDQATAGKQFIVNSNYELFIFALTILVLVNSFLWLFIEDVFTLQVVIIISVGLTAVLTVDVLVRIRRNHSVKFFVFNLQGWLLGLGSLPIPFICLLRFLWYGLIIRRFRRSDYVNISQVIIRKKAQSTLLSVVFIGIVVLEISGITILRAELPSPQANIHDANDALWWAFVTMATVGYGDKYPVTTPGRIIGLFVMSVGVGIFSVLTSYLAQWFVKPREESQPGVNNQGKTNEGALEVSQLHAKIDRLELLLIQKDTAHQDELAQLHQSLARIEAHFRDDTDPSQSE